MNIFRRLLRPFRQAPTKQPDRKTRPTFDLLEDRQVPTVYTVNTVADTEAVDGKVSLREAIVAANTGAADNEAAAGTATNTIQFAASLSGQTITLGAELVVARSLTINGLGASKLTISG